MTFEEFGLGIVRLAWFSVGLLMLVQWCWFLWMGNIYARGSYRKRTLFGRILISRTISPFLFHFSMALGLAMVCLGLAVSWFGPRVVDWFISSAAVRHLQP